MRLVEFGSNDPDFNHEAALNTYNWYMNTEGAELIFKMAVDEYCEDIYQNNKDVFYEVAKAAAEERLETLRKSVANGIINKSMSDEAVDATIEAVDIIKSYMSQYDRQYKRDKGGKFAEVNTWQKKRPNYSGKDSISNKLATPPVTIGNKQLSPKEARVYQEMYRDLADDFDNIKGDVIVEINGQTIRGKDARSILESTDATGKPVISFDKPPNDVTFIGAAGSSVKAPETDKYVVAADKWSQRSVDAGMVNRFESGTTRNMRQVSAASQFMGDAVADTSLGSDKRVQAALRAGKYVGDLGPEAEKVIGPSIRRAAYRYRGVERNPEEMLMDSIRRSVAGSTNPNEARDRMFIPRSVTHETPYGAQEEAELSPFLRYWQNRLPDKNLLDLHLNSGAIAPSEGVILNRQGDVVTQAVGYGDDHYLPFNLKKLTRVKGGQYVRTRTVGGPTTEDIYAGLMSGARSTTVVSHSGVFTVEFDPEFRGGRRYNDKAARMMDRYGKLVDSLDSQSVLLSQIPDSRRQEIAMQAESEVPGNTPGILEERRKRSKQLMDMEKFNPTPSQETREEWKQEFLAEQASKFNRHGDEMEWAQVKIDLESKEGRRLTDDEAIEAMGAGEKYAKYVKYREGQYRQDMSPLQLNGEGYFKAMSALKEQFPYYIKDVKWTPNDQGSKMSDKGYVKPKHLRPKAVKNGYWDRSIEGYSNPSIPNKYGQPSGKRTADTENYGNWAAHARLEEIKRRDKEDDKEGGGSSFSSGGSDAGTAATGTYSPAGRLTTGATGPKYSGFVQSADVARGYQMTPFEQVQSVIKLREQLRKVDVLNYEERGANRSMSIWNAHSPDDPNAEAGNAARGTYTNLMYGSDEEFIDRVESNPEFLAVTLKEADNLKSQLGRSGWQGSLAAAVNTNGLLNKFGDPTPKNPTSAYALVRGLAADDRNKMYDFSTQDRSGSYYLPGLTNREYEAAWKSDPDVARFTAQSEGRFGYQWNLAQDDNKFNGLTKQMGGSMSKGLEQVATWRNQMAQYGDARNVPNPTVVKYGSKNYSIFAASDLENDIAMDALALAKMRQLKSVYANSAQSPRIPNDVIATEPYHPSLKSGQTLKEESIYDNPNVVSLDAPREDADSKDAAISRSRLETEKIKTAQMDMEKVNAIRSDLDTMVGLKGVKDEFNALVDDAIVNQKRQAAGLPTKNAVNNLVFVGHPGTGKTTVAEKLAQSYHAIGALPTDNVTVVSRADLVGEYSGHTAVKTRNVFNKGKGGVIFIDEAYALQNGPDDSFGKEAIDEIVNLSEQNRNDTVVILAGYPGDMKNLMGTNPGLKSRFPRTINFPNYSGGEISQIGHKQASDLAYEFEPAASKVVQGVARRIANRPDSANGRDIRNFNNAVRRAHSQRVAGLGDNLTRQDMITITADDVKRAEKDYFGTVTKRLVAV